MPEEKNPKGKILHYQKAVRNYTSKIENIESKIKSQVEKSASHQNLKKSNEIMVNRAVRRHASLQRKRNAVNVNNDIQPHG